MHDYGLLSTKLVTWCAHKIGVEILDMEYAEPLYNEKNVLLLLLGEAMSRKKLESWKPEDLGFYVSMLKHVKDMEPRMP